MNRHPTHQIHPHSSDAYSSTRDLRDTRREAVYQTLLRSPRPLTDREVMQAMGFTDMNAVRPRLTDLRDDFWVLETGVTQCTVTGRKVRLCRALRENERAVLLTTLRPQVDRANRVAPEGVAA